MLIWNDYSKYNFDDGVPEKTFGEMVEQDKYTLPEGYYFYHEPLKAQFEKKFYRHFKYNQIAYPNTSMFNDMFLDIMEVNAPKYEHYYKVLEEAKKYLKWWNNKDYVVTLARELDRSNITNFETTMRKIDVFNSNMIRTGENTTDFTRNLTTANNETAGAENGNEVKHTGKDGHAITKKGNVTTDFSRELTSFEEHRNNSESSNRRININESNNDTITNSSDEKTSNNTTKNLDTPQGTLDNLMTNVNAYMSSGTVDSSRETDITNTTTNSKNTGNSTDVTTDKSSDNKNLNAGEGGKTNNVEEYNLVDSDVREVNLTDTTTETLSSRRDTNITEEGTTQNKETRNTKDALKGDKIGNDTGTNKGTETGKDTEKFTRTEQGNIGVTSAGQLVEDWLNKGYINIDKMIIRDCEELFLQVY